MFHNFGPEKRVVAEPALKLRISRFTCKHSTTGLPSQMSILSQ